MRMELREHQFGVLIDLGNDAMREPEHVSDALRSIADKIDSGEYTGTVTDENGSNVGTFHVEFWPIDDDARDALEGS
jgi:hypothetical protein